VEAETIMAMSTKAMSKLRILTAHYIRAIYVMVNDSKHKANLNRAGT